MNSMARDKVYTVARRKANYLFQKTTGLGIDKQLERELISQSTKYLTTQLEHIGKTKSYCVAGVGDFDFSDRKRYMIFRNDIYRRFVASENGTETDHFDRRGKWVARGSVIYFDNSKCEYVKVVDDYFCRRGEGRFLRDALERGLYDFLCPKLSYIIVDRSGFIRGYAIRGGKQVTPYQFERYVSGSLRELISKVTELTGLYFYDMTFHNVVVHKGMLSFIDLESVLPIEWFGKGEQFSLDHLSEIDIGWSIQKKWRSPMWYWKFVKKLSERKW
jgi:hypothetical protein